MHNRPNIPPPPPGVWFVTFGLLVCGVSFLYFVWAGRERVLPVIAPHTTDESNNLKILAASAPSLILLLLVFAAFFGGAAMVVRVARMFRVSRHARSRTEYVDTWSAYRISAEEIAAADPDAAADDESDSES